MCSTTFNGYEYTRAEADAEAFEDRVSALVKDWDAQLKAQGFITEGGPFASDSIYEADLIDWAERENVPEQFCNSNHIDFLLDYHARAYLNNEWD